MNSVATEDEQLLAGLDEPRCLDIHAARFFNGFAVCRAGMVEPACAVTTAAAVDDTTIGQAKQKGMSGILATRVIPRRLTPGRDEPPVFEDALAGRQCKQGENALAVDRGPPHRDSLHDRWVEEETCGV